MEIYGYIMVINRLCHMQIYLFFSIAYNLSLCFSDGEK